MAKAKVQINEASREELAALPGIGPATAETLIKLRKEKGGFKSVEELEQVPGIGSQTLQELRPHVAVSKNGGSAARKVTEVPSKPAETAAKVAGSNGAQAVEKANEASRGGMQVARETASTQAETMRQTAETGTVKAREMAETGTAKAKEMAETAADVQHDMLGAVRQAQEAWFGLVQEQMTANMQAARRLAECRTLQDFAGFQAEYVRESMDRFVSGSARVAFPAQHLAGLLWSPERWQQLTARR